MRRMISVGILVFFFACSMAAAKRPNISMPLINDTGMSVEVLEASQSRTVVRYGIGTFGKEEVDIDGNPYYKITLGREAVGLTVGHPELPIVNRSIIIPENAQFTLKVISSEYNDFPHTPVAPSKGPIPIGTNPDDIPYVFGDIYDSAKWYPQELAVLSEPFHIRQFRGVTIRLYPFQYHPESATLRAYTSVTLEVVCSGGRVSSFSGARMIPEFSYIHENLFINYQSWIAPVLAKASATTEGEMAEMLVITHDDFADEMADFVQWKNQKGIKTTMVKVIEACDGDVTSLNIKALIQDYYDNNNSLTYVLLVGDADQVPTFVYSGGSANSDYWYAQLTIGGENDYYPDIIIGRFSAENSTHVSTQVLRSIDYEKNPQGEGWFGKCTVMGDEDFYGFAEDIADILLPAYDLVDEFYEPYYGSEYELGLDFTYAINDENEGRSFVSYSGHGCEEYWSGLDIHERHFDDNQNRLPFIFSVACLPGDFDHSEPCFGEKLLRKRDQNFDPVGAVAAYMSSMVQSLPLVDYAHEAFCHALIDDDIRNSFGSLCYYGATCMIDFIPQEGYEMAAGWVVFGDPSLQVRTSDPTPIYAIHDVAIDYDASSYTATVRSNDGADTSIAEARCGLYQSGIMYGSAFTDEYGEAEININEPILTGGPLLLTVTGYNTETFQADVQVQYSDLVVTTIPLPATTKYCLANPNEPDTGYVVICNAYSEYEINEEYPRLWYRVNDDGWIDEIMTATGDSSEYVALIPYQQPGDNINYKIEAEDDGEGSYTTDIFSFSVIDYGLLLRLDGGYNKSEQYGNQVLFEFTVTNDGVLRDSYNLSAVSSLGWTVVILDPGGMEIDETSDLDMDESYSFSIQVTVESDVEGDLDEITVTATSSGSADNPPPSESIVCRVESEGVPRSLPFVETFPDENLDLTNWEDNCRINISNAALYNEHGSPEYSALFQFSSPSPECSQTDISLTSQQVDLSSQSYAHVRFWYERTGSGDSPEAGDDLIVEYANNLGQWLPFASIPGEGDDMTDFGDSHHLTIPEDGLHHRFRIRFSSLFEYHSGIDPQFTERDAWFVDDITVTHPVIAVTTEPLGNTEYCQLYKNPEESAGYLVYCRVFADHQLEDEYPRVLYSVGGVDQPDVIMGPAGESGEYSGAIPYQSGGAQISYRVDVEDIYDNMSSTDVFSFAVSEYGLMLNLDDDPSKWADSGQAVDFTLLVTNGCLHDEYELATSGPGDWEVSFYDMQEGVIESIPILNPGQYYPFKARVTVNSGVVGLHMPITVTATSINSDDPKPSSSIEFEAISGGVGVSFPFIETFPNANLDFDKWNLDLRNFIDEDATNEPSEPYSLHFWYSSDMCGNDELTSDAIDISGYEEDIIVSYAYEQGGSLDNPNSGDDLIIEYLGHAGLWWELSRQSGGQTSMNEFATVHCDAVPAEYKHSHFAIRLRIVSEQDPGDPASVRDNWFVDDIIVSFGVPGNPPTLLAPVDGASSDDAQPNLQWTSEPSAPHYEVIIDDDEDFTSPHATAQTANSTWQVTPALSEGIYYWKVRSSNEGIYWSDWSTPRTYIMSLCNCGVKGDLDNDGEATALDLTILVDYLFAQVDNRDYPDEWNCPNDLGDFDCDGFPTALDLSLLIDYLFGGQDAICDGCDLE